MFLEKGKHFGINSRINDTQYQLTSRLGLFGFKDSSTNRHQKKYQIKETNAII